MALALRLAHLRVEAWAAVRGDGQLAAQVDALDKSVAEIPAARDRALAYAAAGEVLSASAALKPEVSEAFFHKASQEFTQEKGKARDALAEALLKARAQGLLNAVRAHVAAGARQQATRLAGRLEALARQAPAAVAPTLYGFESHARRLLGDGSAARSALERALAGLHKSASVEDEARQLRAIVGIGGGHGGEEVQAALGRALANAQKWSKREHAAVLVELGVIHAGNGNVQAENDIVAQLAELATTLPSGADELKRLEGLSAVAAGRLSRQKGDFAASDESLRQAAMLG